MIHFLRFDRYGDFTDYKPMTDAQWSAFYEWMCARSYEWTEQHLEAVYFYQEASND